VAGAPLDFARLKRLRESRHDGRTMREAHFSIESPVNSWKIMRMGRKKKARTHSSLALHSKWSQPVEAVTVCFFVQAIEKSVGEELRQKIATGIERPLGGSGYLNGC